MKTAALWARAVSSIACIVLAGCANHHGEGNGDAGNGGGGGDATGGGPDASTNADHTLAIAPLADVLTVPIGTTPTVQYTATEGGLQVAPEWTIDRGELGNLDVSTGIFTAAGTIGGVGTVTAMLGSGSASTTIEIDLAETENGDPAYMLGGSAGAGGFGGVGGNGPGQPAGSDQLVVLGGSALPDSSVQILYPYDGTVWPRGILAPLIAWDPKAHDFDAVKIQLHSNHFDYTGTFGSNAAPFMNVPIPADAWSALSYSNDGPTDPVTVTITFSDATTGTAIGPYVLTWHIAHGTLKGTVYYNSYGTALVVDPLDPTKTGNSGDNDFNGHRYGAATLAIRPGATSPVVVAGTYSADNTGCRVCHTVSANGQELMTQHGDSYATSSLYDLQTGSSSPVAGDVSVWPALAPDGSWYMTTSGTSVATGGDTSTRAYSNAGVLESPQPTMTPAGLEAMLPVFSPDGNHMAFNFWGGATGADSKSLATLSYDSTTQTFSGLTTLFTPSTGQVSWSSFLPTNDAVVFEDELVSGNGEFGFTWMTGQGQLYWVDLATQTSSPLNALNGIGSDGVTPYLPTYGSAHTGAADTKLNFEPTVSPVVSGGYAWVVFTSRRLYGNVATTSAYNSDPRTYNWRTTITPKKLWVAAIDLSAPPGTDPSHPAFYLPAQELYAGNARGVWTVDPCQQDGTSCETGDECCGGYCRDGSDGSGLECTSTQPSCSMEYEMCTSTADCCGGSAAGISCVDGYCAQGIVIQ